MLTLFLSVQLLTNWQGSIILDRDITCSHCGSVLTERVETKTGTIITNIIGKYNFSDITNEVVLSSETNTSLILRSVTTNTFPKSQFTYTNISRFPWYNTPSYTYTNLVTPL